jgi:hypothetical protein
MTKLEPSTFLRYLWFYATIITVSSNQEQSLGLAKKGKIVVCGNDPIWVMWVVSYNQFGVRR